MKAPKLAEKSLVDGKLTLHHHHHHHHHDVGMYEFSRTNTLIQPNYPLFKFKNPKRGPHNVSPMHQPMWRRSVKRTVVRVLESMMAG